ncbi:MAG: hypothetical protein HYZ91_03495 [Candidatus Omnitrophica bacterium]|nr:hypothetical protein [Candidatus Omnitrophota bacterium]
MDGKKQRALVVASLAGLVAAAGMVWSGHRAQAAEGDAEEGGAVPCYGINKCKGTGDCGGTGHSCAGQNACKGQAFIDLEKDVCLRIGGGRLTPEAQG